MVGLARSGVAAAKLLQRLGAEVVVNDEKPAEQLAGDLEELGRLGIPAVTGGHPASLLDGTDLVVKNPGIPYDRPLLEEALRRGIPIITEIEVAYRAAQGPILAITGSNGKTTTTSLVAEMFREAGIPAVAAGNIGTALSRAVLDAPPGTWLIVELSSFQLAGALSFRPRVAGLLNVFPAHLDYHGTMERYLAAKARIFAQQKAGDIAVLAADHKAVAGLVGDIAATVWWTSARRPVRTGVYSNGEAAVFVPPNGAGSEELLPVSEIRIQGAHNLENALSASALALAAGVPAESVRRALRSFRGVEHRLEFVREVRGVRFFNDSKATNPTAAARALSSFSGPVVAILGGLDRGDDLATLVSALASGTRAVVALGQSASRMAEAAREAGVSAVVFAGDVPEAVREAYALAVPGDVVLLSPAAASWDMFTSFEERGRIFKEAVHKL